MNDAQSTIVGLKAQCCPGGGFNGMPKDAEPTVALCLDHGVCGCIYGDAVKEIERMRAVLKQIADQRTTLPIGSQYVAEIALRALGNEQKPGD